MFLSVLEPVTKPAQGEYIDSQQELKPALSYSHTLLQVVNVHYWHTGALPFLSVDLGYIQIT